MVEIKMRKEKIIVILVYKPPNVSNDVCINQLGMLLDRCYVEYFSVYTAHKKLRIFDFAAKFLG